MEAAVSAALLFLVWTGAAALTVNIPKDNYEFARGDNVTLPCTFKSASSNPSLAIISWSANDELIGTNYQPAGDTDIKPGLEDRFSIIGDWKTGRADLKISSISLAENKEFECRVQIPKDDEGKTFDITQVLVKVPPSPPICKIQGKAEYGQNINLTCNSEEGSPAPTYTWKSQDVQLASRSLNQLRNTVNGGILSLFNISKETSGYFICTSKNSVGSSFCNITVSVMPPSMNIGSTAGIIAGAVAGLIVLIIIIYCCCCRKKEEQKDEYAMGVPMESDLKGEGRRGDGEESTRGFDDSSVTKERRDNYEGRSEVGYDRNKDSDDRRRDRDYDDRRSEYSDRPRDYDDRRSEYSDRPRDYDDRRSEYSDRPRDYDDRRSEYSDRPRDRDYDDRRSEYSDRPRDRDYDDRRSEYSDRPRDRDYDDRSRDRGYDNRRDRASDR